MTPERKLKNKTIKNLPENMRMFRTNTGQAWTGKIIQPKKGSILWKLLLGANTIILKNPRPFHGLPEGYPDLTGWTSIEITSDMVGKKIAVFTAYELKATGRLTKKQSAFRKVLESMGGIFKIIKE